MVASTAKALSDGIWSRATQKVETPVAKPIITKESLLICGLVGIAFLYWNRVRRSHVVQKVKTSLKHWNHLTNNRVNKAILCLN